MFRELGKQNHALLWLIIDNHVELLRVIGDAGTEGSEVG